MYSRILIILCRKKLSIFLVSSILFLTVLWSWAFYNSTYSSNEDNKDLSSNGKQYLLQKLISQANNIIKNQRHHEVLIKPTPIAHVKYKYLPEEYIFEEERLKMLQNQQRIIMEDSSEKKYETSAEKQSQYEHDLQRMGIPVITGIGPGRLHPPNNRLVHLDLKGAPPKLSFLKGLLPIFKTLGATGLLLEYEDMFPYNGSLKSVSAKNSYDKDELMDFLESVYQHGLNIIPLVQTFGHLEYVLKLQEYEHLREIPDSPQSICPSLKFSIQLIQDMITDIIEFHLKINKTNILSNFTHIHIGCDEVYRMGECPKCSLHTRNDLFLTHVINIASFIRSKWPYLKVLIWDDMLRDMTLTDMQNSHIGIYVEPMIWVYSNDIYRFIQPQLWDKYSKVFPTAWAASAYKGAFGENLLIPPIQKHLENNLRWLIVIANEGGRFSRGFQGIALTGWQRYDHFATLCELLPTGIPSLMICLSTISRGYFSVDINENTIFNILKCPNDLGHRRSGRPWIDFHSTSHNHLFTTCTFPTSSIYKFILCLFEKISDTKMYLTNIQEKSAWMSNYNIQHNFSSPNRIIELTSNIHNLIEDLEKSAKECVKIFEDVYDKYTIAEFIEIIIYPLIMELQKIDENGKSLLSQKVWPKRPLPYNRYLNKLNLFNKTSDSSNDAN